jgi:hypothetical protein
MPWHPAAGKANGFIINESFGWNKFTISGDPTVIEGLTRDLDVGRKEENEVERIFETF